MKIVIIGGHLTPALSVIEELKGNEILYIGRKYALEGDKALSLEFRTMLDRNIRFKSLITGRLQRKFTIYTIPSLLKIPIGFVQSFFILRNFKPDVIVGFGGYVQIPVIFAAAILRIPVVLHEQTLGAGLANRICSFFAKKICISWEPSNKFFPKDKTILTGNPVRREILLSSSSQTAGKPVIYITGGSQGSHGINSLVEQSLNELLKNFRIIHQTGDARQFLDFERLTERRKELEEKSDYFVKKFLTTEEIGEVLRNASLVVSRAGMNTITELIYLGKPCFLIPLPMGGEQKQNALFMKSLGLCEVSNQEDLTATVFVGIIESMIKNLEHYKTNRDFQIDTAAKKVSEEVLNAGSKV